ncbi:MAG TPA: hypothetical protein VMZ28_05710 [Kofleriaceae bacterium]|nr:hypothetical protein [Kofleriaceae bacterium]
MLVVLGVMMLLWASSAHLRAGYARRLAALSAAETRVWQRAFSPGCADGAKDGQHVRERVTLDLRTTEKSGLRLGGTVSAGAYFPCIQVP